MPASPPTLFRAVSCGSFCITLELTLTADAALFIHRWSASGGSERANYALFLSELCDVLDVPRPDVATAAGHGQYVFEREVRETFSDGTSTARFIDLYKQGSFVLEAKQGVEAQDAAEEQQRAFIGKTPRKKRVHCCSDSIRPATPRSSPATWPPHSPSWGRVWKRPSNTIPSRKRSANSEGLAFRPAI